MIQFQEHRAKLIAEYKTQQRFAGIMARRNMASFATYMNDDIEIEWFHKIVYEYIDKWIAGDIKKIAIFMPPQHGKSTMSSETTPAKILGMFPKAKIVVSSYSETLASKFNRACQDIIDSPRFQSIYPGVVLPAKGVESTNELRNNTFFEVVGHKGFFKAVSVGGQLTGTSIDFGIIDDPIKDRKQANSETYRNGLWDWYNDVFKTRLHNDSRQMMLFTRWHMDDLAGRLFDPKNKYYNEAESKEWTVICLPALKEIKSPMAFATPIDDPRAVDDALWENKHSAEKHIRTRESNPTTHASLNQQRPSPSEGGDIKKEWFNIIQPAELPFNPDTVKKDFWIDGAFTDKVKNDESATLTCSMYKGNLYIFNCHGVRKELNEFLDYIVPFMKSNGYNGRSSVWIEMKASGYGFYSMLKSSKYGSHNCRKVNSKTVSEGKSTRVQNSQPTLASGKVYLVNGSWIQEFIEQCVVFPNGTHDDMVDVLAYAINYYFIHDDDVSISYS